MIILQTVPGKCWMNITESYEFIRPLHRDCPDRGKPVGLNDAMKLAKGEIIIVI